MKTTQPLKTSIRTMRMFWKFSTALVIAACGFNTSALAAQERWSVTEGLAGEPHGVWTIEPSGDELVVFAEMFDANGERTTYFLSGKRENENVVFDRQPVGSEAKCTYSMNGSPPQIGDPLAGVSDCGGASGVWMAKRIPDPEESSFQDGPSRIEE